MLLRRLDIAMGHRPEAQYSKDYELYMEHGGREPYTNEWLRERYQDPSNYRVEDPGRNRAHDDEISRK